MEVALEFLILKFIVSPIDVRQVPAIILAAVGVVTIPFVFVKLILKYGLSQICADVRVVVAVALTETIVPSLSMLTGLPPRRTCPVVLRLPDEEMAPAEEMEIC